MTSPRTALILEDDELLGATLVEALDRHGFVSTRCRTLQQARVYLGQEGAAVSHDLLVLDVLLPDGTGLDLLHEFARDAPFKAIVAISGMARPTQSFELAQLGVECFVPKPIDLAALEYAVEQALTRPVNLRPALRKLVGRRAICDVETEVRSVMVEEAVARAGSVRGAARLLSISRQLLQHILRNANPRS
jgi:two-component system response regulator RegA